MGLFDKVKTIANVLTGGCATVTLESDSVTLDKPFKIRVTAVIGNADLKISKVYLLIYGHEDINIDTVKHDDQGREYSAPLELNNDTAKLELTLDQTQVLSAYKTYLWEVDVQLPDNAPPIYQGCYCRHIYRALAGLDCTGNDPDSGWIELPS